MNYLIIKLIILSLVLPLFLFIWRQLAKIWTTPSILVLEDVFNCDTVFETQLWLFYKKYLFKNDIFILLWKYFSRQIYWYDFHNFKLNNLKTIHHL
jgi:hypothetical protein